MIITKSVMWFFHLAGIYFSFKKYPLMSSMILLPKLTYWIPRLSEPYTEYLVYILSSSTDEIGSFDIESQNLYSFLTQDAAQFYGCLFIFDRKNLIINAYRPENLGKDTNINIGFRNLQKSNEISVDEELCLIICLCFKQPVIRKGTPICRAVV